jgi:hypothetical protein
MKYSVGLLGLLSVGSVSAFTVPFGSKVHRSKSTLSMVLEKPVDKKLAKIETLKIESNHLIHPLREVRLLRGSKRAVVVYYLVLEVMILIFPLLTDKCRRIERPRPISQWTVVGKL